MRYVDSATEIEKSPQTRIKPAAARAAAPPDSETRGKFIAGESSQYKYNAADKRKNEEKRPSAN